MRPSSVLHPTVKLCDNDTPSVSGAHKTRNATKRERDALIRKRAVRDPLLRPVDDPVLPVVRLDGPALQARDVAARERLRDRERDELFAGEDLGEDLGLHRGGAVVEHGREPDYSASLEPVAITARAAATQLLRDDHFVEIVELAVTVFS